jgi:hypothetical protein
LLERPLAANAIAKKIVLPFAARGRSNSVLFGVAGRVGSSPFAAGGRSYSVHFGVGSSPFAAWGRSNSLIAAYALAAIL